jgi:transcriptional regulator with XRE-family HTH domain
MANSASRERLNNWNAVVGGNVRAARTRLGLTQQAIAQQLDISYQQQQKYETGANRISAGRLYEISKILDISISQLFMGCSGGDELAVPLAEMDDVAELRENFQALESLASRRATQPGDALTLACLLGFGRIDAVEPDALT